MQISICPSAHTGTRYVFAPGQASQNQTLRCMQPSRERRVVELWFRSGARRMEACTQPLTACCGTRELPTGSSPARPIPVGEEHMTWISQIVWRSRLGGPSLIIPNVLARPDRLGEKVLVAMECAPRSSTRCIRRAMGVMKKVDAPSSSRPTIGGGPAKLRRGPRWVRGFLMWYGGSFAGQTRAVVSP